MRIITGKARGLHLNVPKNYEVRPTADRVKESLFNIIGSKVVDAAVLDLFAGSGNLGLESWSRGARFVQFVDNSRMSLQLTDSNIRKCRAEWLVAEHSAHDDITDSVPEGYEMFRNQQYGETVLSFIKRTY